ncbi:MAG: hypothetical protein PF484_09260 [Bacteroidales bacterium]|jgi:hypothetical protein|nr:hypothetical protein [Bacteroidales bacterium]
MKLLKLIAVAIAITGISACNTNEKKEISSTVSGNSVTEITKPKTSLNDKIFKKLDRILSPFEDMTEYALEKNEVGITKSLNQVLKAEKELVFKNNLSGEALKTLSPKLKELQELVTRKKHQQIALLSTEIFEFNTTNFIYAKEIENQIKIEHLDYLGFQTLALLNQDKIEWKQLEVTIAEIEKVWVDLSKNIKDNNLKDSFEYLFEGLDLSTKNKDVKMTSILASMDLSLVDVLENSF